MLAPMLCERYASAHAPASVRESCAQQYLSSLATLRHNATDGHYIVIQNSLPATAPFVNNHNIIPRRSAADYPYPEALAEWSIKNDRREPEVLQDAYLQKAELSRVSQPGSAYLTNKCP